MLPEGTLLSVDSHLECTMAGGERGAGWKYTQQHGWILRHSAGWKEEKQNALRDTTPLVKNKNTSQENTTIWFVRNIQKNHTFNP